MYSCSAGGDFAPVGSWDVESALTGVGSGFESFQGGGSRFAGGRNRAEVVLTDNARRSGRAKSKKNVQTEALDDGQRIRFSSKLLC